MRSARLRIESRPGETQVLVVPDDGSELLCLRVSRAFLSARAGGAAVAIIRCFVGSFEIRDVEGRTLEAQGRDGLPVIYPDVRVTGPDVVSAYVDWVAWQFDASGPLPRIRAHHIELRAMP